MEQFRWVTLTLTMVLALGMTRLLTTAVALYRLRSRAQMDWVPFVWAICVFYSLLEFSWALQELGTLVERWTFPLFLTLLGLALILFVAAALILPTELQDGESLRMSFKHDGRSGLAFLAGYEALTNVANWYFWGASPFTLIGGINVTLAGLAIAYLCVSSRKAQWIITVLFALLDLGTAVLV